MAYNETDRSFIRHFLGYSAIFIQADLRLENAIQASQSTADGGTRPDSSTENYIKGLIYGFAAVTGTQNGVTPGPTSTTGVTFASPAVRGLLQIEANIATLDSVMGSTAVDEVRIDTARESARLSAEGRKLVTAMATMLSTSPRRDIFSSTKANPEGSAFYNLPDGMGSGYQW